MTVREKVAELRKHTPAKRSEYEERYNRWAGNPVGNAPDFNKCAKEVWPSQSFTSSQCSRPCGYGRNGAYCKQHAKKPNHKPETP